eukprot:Nk52_evm55s352 gene=Nk52_evmTU55s352
MAAVKIEGGLLVTKDALEEKVLNICKMDPQGITDDFLKQTLSPGEVDMRVQAINGLLNGDKIDLMQNPNGQIMYRAKDDKELNKFEGMSPVERLVYQIVQEAGNKGIWTRDLRHKSNLQQTEISKILKLMENRKLIKSVKSVQASKKKVYMLYELEPDRSLTGGAWYSEQEFESEFVEVLNTYCYRFILQKKSEAEDSPDPVIRATKGYATSKEVKEYIEGLKLSKVELSVEDIESILDILIFDGKVEEITVGLLKLPMISSKKLPSDTKLYRVIPGEVRRSAAAGSVFTPCIGCGNFGFCDKSGPVNASNCVYMKDWLEF